MAQPVKPVAKVVYVCDDVVRDNQSRKVSLLNLWDVVRVPENGTFPCENEFVDDQIIRVLPP
jgi:hypothetical protein